MTHYITSLISDEHASTFLAVFLTAISAWLKQTYEARKEKRAADAAEADRLTGLEAKLAEINAGADDKAMDHMQRSSDRLLEELTNLQDRFLSSLTHAAEIQGKMNAAEEENIRLRKQLDTLQDAYEKMRELEEPEAISTVDIAKDVADILLSKGATLSDDDTEDF